MQRFVTLLFGLLFIFSLAVAQETDSLSLGDFEDDEVGLGIWTGSIGAAYVTSIVNLNPDPVAGDEYALECEIDCGLSDDDENKGGFSTSGLNIVVDGDTATALVIWIWIDEEAHSLLDGVQIFAMDQSAWQWQSAWYSAGMVTPEAWFRMVYNFSQSFENVAGFDTLMNAGLNCGVEFVFNATTDWVGFVYGNNTWLLGVKADPSLEVEPAPLASVPGTFTLEQNYPNPFNPTTNIVYTLPQRDRVTISIYDVTGRLVTTLVDNEPQPAGRVAVPFNAGDLSSGIYYYKVQTSYEAQMKKMVLVR
jgi:hypothetical protein